MTEPATIVVRTTMQPDRDLEVSVAEAKDLFRQGLLALDDPGPAKQGKTVEPKTDPK